MARPLHSDPVLPKELVIALGNRVAGLLLQCQFRKKFIVELSINICITDVIGLIQNIYTNRSNIFL